MGPKQEVPGPTIWALTSALRPSSTRWVWKWKSRSVAWVASSEVLPVPHGHRCLRGGDGGRISDDEEGGGDDAYEESGGGRHGWRKSSSGRWGRAEGKRGGWSGGERSG